MVVLLHLVEAYPGKTADLCPKLTAGPTRERCERINARPHLWTAPEVVTLQASRKGPASMHLPTLDATGSRFGAIKAVKGPCAHRQDAVTCYTSQAVREISRGEVERAAGACVAIAAENWRSECMFSLAETSIERRGAAGIADASDLCLAARAFSPNCMGHLVERLARDAPDATVVDPTAWAPVLQSALTLRETWETRDPRLADLYVDRLWSEVARLAYGWTPEVTGGPLAALPAEAIPHVRASAAARLVDLEGVGAHPSLDAWVAALMEALGRTAITAVPRTATDLPHDRAIFWPSDAPGDAAFPAIAYLGSGRRTVSEDPETDLRLCVLEAVARASLTPASQAAARALLDEGARDPDAAVRWTATRLRDRPPVDGL